MEKIVRVPCDCGCCLMEFTKDVWGEGEVTYDLSVLDSRYDHNINGIFGRLRRAAGILFGKPVYFNDVNMSEEKFDALLKELAQLRES